MNPATADGFVAAHWFVDAEGAHEPGDGRRHAVTGIRIDVVAQQAGLHQLGGSIPFPHRPLAGAEHGDVARATFLERSLAFLGHDVVGLIPGYRRKLAVLVEFAVLHAQQWRGQAILAVLDLGQEVTLDAVEPSVDRRVRVALGGDDAPPLGSHQHAAARSAVAAGALVPAHAIGLRGCRLADAGNADARRGGGGGNGIALDKITASQGQFHLILPHQDRVQTGCRPMMRRARLAAG